MSRSRSFQKVPGRFLTCLSLSRSTSKHSVNSLSVGMETHASVTGPSPPVMRTFWFRRATATGRVERERDEKDEKSGDLKKEEEKDGEEKKREVQDPEVKVQLKLSTGYVSPTN